MTVFLSTLGQMAQLALFICIGFVLVRAKILPASGAGLLSRMENWIFVPALILGTFMKNFTPARLSTAWQYLLCGTAVTLFGLVAALLLAPCCTKDAYIRKLYTYGLTFSNFGFMGNAVVLALFPDLFADYLIFVIPLWILIYGWAVPVLLIPQGSGEKTLRARLKPFVNPMFIAMLAGMILGLTGLPIPAFFSSACDALGACMSPVAMLLTGMTVAATDLRAVFRNKSIYAVTGLRLLLLPLVAILLLMLLPLPEGIAICVVCSLAMPLGLNTVVVPGAYGLDTSVAAGMALISHLFSVGTIPLIFTLFSQLV
ncbi:MAG: AEC family transporter [Clostridia bacterium]|nr:AEC family transporter [Clostridia bacterium]